MKLIWDEETQQYIESWAFEEWYFDPKNYPSNSTIKSLTQLEYYG